MIKLKAFQRQNIVKRCFYIIIIDIFA